jgi:hypothetical protein
MQLWEEEHMTEKSIVTWFVGTWLGTDQQEGGCSL